MTLPWRGTSDPFGVGEFGLARRGVADCTAYGDDAGHVVHRLVGAATGTLTAELRNTKAEVTRNSTGRSRVEEDCMASRRLLRGLYRTPMAGLARVMQHIPAAGSRRRNWRLFSAERFDMIATSLPLSRDW